MLDFKQQQNLITFEPRIIMGVTRFKDSIDGNEIDTCNVFIATPFNTESELSTTSNALGFGVAKVKFGTSANFHRFAGMSFPTTVNVAFKTVTTGSGKSQTVMVDFKHLDSSPVKQQKE